MKTYTAKPGEIQRDWYVVDAEGKTLGRLATQIADTLRGKQKPQYTPHVDTGDFVIVVNAEKIKLTGKKREQKTYIRHTGWVGHLKPGEGIHLGWKIGGANLAAGWRGRDSGQSRSFS